MMAPLLLSLLSKLWSRLSIWFAVAGAVLAALGVA